MKSNRYRVALLSKYIPHYRQQFLIKLKDRLNQVGVDFLIIYGQPDQNDAKKKDAIEIPEGIFRRNIIFSIGKYELYWQPVLPLLKDVDLVIVEQASRILTNYVLLLENALKIRKLAFWGHGKNFQVENANRVSEWMKQKYSTKVHWWFAYNELSANLIEKLGYPRDRITVVQNAIDTYQIHEAFIHQKSEDLASLCRNLEIRGHHVGLYVGGMYAEKRLNFLLDACELIRQQLYDFEMIFVGSGSEGQKVQEAAQKHRWIHYVGPKFGLERVPYFAISQVFLMPGAVGLAILDCFALELPMIAANVPGNGPEIEYLRNDFNGIMVEDFNNPGAYAQAAISILQDEKRRQILIRGCQESNSFYSIEEMVERFACGIQMALEK